MDQDKMNISMQNQSIDTTTQDEPHNTSSEKLVNKPTAIIVIGMAGSGKTTLMQVT